MKKLLYLCGIILSASITAVAFTVLGDTKIIAPALLVLSIYLFSGSLIKLCRTSPKLKGTVFCAVDLLWWLP